MKLLIDINKYEYERAKELVSEGVLGYTGNTAHLFKSVANGTPLTNECNDLLNQVSKEIDDLRNYSYIRQKGKMTKPTFASKSLMIT